MHFEITDKRDFTWVYFDWTEHSHPAISIRLRLYKYVFALGYLRIRPWAYIHGPEYKRIVPDSRFVIDRPSFYKIEDQWYYTQKEWKIMQSQVHPDEKTIHLVNARLPFDREWTNHLIRHDQGITLDQKIIS